jgi:HAD superfamily hydrolase (TIGR01484 family)
MRIAVSDYDGTLFYDGRVKQEDIEAIHTWRKAGNLFGWATGRDLSLALHGAKRWGIPFDFLVCMNGAALYDSNLRLLKSRDIPQGLIRSVLTHPAALASMHYQLCINGINKIYIRSERSYFRKSELSFQQVTYEDALLVREVQQISLAYASEHDYYRYAESLQTDFRDMLSFNLNGFFIDINQKGVNKLSGLLDILAIQGWPAEDLLAIGDGENDMSMIRHFKGFSVSNAPEKVARAAAAVYHSVGEMLLDKL